MTNVQTLYSFIDCIGWLVIGLFLGMGMAGLLFLLISKNEEEVDDDL